MESIDDDLVVVTEDELIHAAWWIFVLQGLLGIIFGLIAVFFPGFVLGVLAFFLGAIIILYSLSVIIQGFVGNEKGSTKILMVILGILGIIIGILALMNIEVLGLTIALLLALWAFLTGFSHLWLALTATQFQWYRILLFLSGIIFIILGFFLVMTPLMATAALIWVLGIFGVAFGVVLIILGLVMQSRIKKLAESQ
jgi:uncharacterized membrane protein HdeD (DUF308 family)